MRKTVQIIIWTLVITGCIILTNAGAKAGQYRTYYCSSLWGIDNFLTITWAYICSGESECTGVGKRTGGCTWDCYWGDLHVGHAACVYLPVPIDYGPGPWSL